jgi:transglutaminase-like putative cysteine protease
LVGTIGVFLLHGIVVSLVALRNPLTVSRAAKSGRRGKLEGALIGIAAPALVLAFVFLLPSDFLEHNPIINLLGGEADPQPIPAEGDPDPFPEGNPSEGNTNPWDRYFGGRADGRGEQEGDGRQQGLQGIPAEQWNSGRQGQSQGQRAVMILAADSRAVYAADEYFDRFDPRAGFTSRAEEGLNELTYLRLLDTWNNADPPSLGRLRREVEVDVFSTITDRVLAYEPVQIEPTIQDNRYYPFRYSYESVSAVAEASPGMFRAETRLTESDRERLASYLEIDLPADVASAFEAHFAEHIDPNASYAARVEQIMRSFSEFQYELGFDDNVNTAKMARFLSEIRAGDCTEFSNSAAFLGRMAGIPSRVVTGWLGARDLQTPQHMRGLLMLQQSIPELAGYELNELFLVTTAHRHSWVQFYVPETGWVDFEPTSYAIPPAPGDNPNSAQVIIPLLDPRENPGNARPFPWALLGRLAAGLAIAVLVGLYAFRYGRELALSLIVRRGLRGRALDRAAEALYRLTLIRLAAEGFELKSRAETAREYSGRLEQPELSDLAGSYDRIRYRSRTDDEERSTLLRRMYERARAALGRARERSGARGLLRRVFSLRSLHYR